MITIHSAMLQDITAIGLIHGRAERMDQTISSVSPLSLRDRQELKETRQLICAKQNGVVYGYAAFYIKYGVVVWINDLCVDPMQRRKGVGERLLDRIERFAENASCTVVATETHPENKAILRFFNRNDYAVANDLLHEAPYHSIGKTLPLPDKIILAKAIPST